MCENTRVIRMAKAMADDLHCSCQRATQISRLRSGAKQSSQLQAGSSIFCPEDEFNVSQAFISSRSLSSVNNHSRLHDTACKCCFSPCQRTLNSTSECPSRSMLRKNSSSSRTKNHFSSILQHQLRLVSFLLLLSLSLFHQVDLATARAMGNPQHGQDDDTTLPARCTLPFSHYDCGSIASFRYTYLNGSCQSTLEWIGGSGCEYDGTENSFATEQECLEVCVPASPTTAAPLSETTMNCNPGPTPTSSSQSEGSTDADIATTNSVDETPTVDTTICFLPIEENCPMITFPTSYFYYDLASLSCLSRVSFCPMSGPNIFFSLEDCLNACERPLTPTTTTETPTTITEAPPTTTETTTTDCPPPLTTTTEAEGAKSPITRTTQLPKDDFQTTEPPLTTTTEKATPTSKSPDEPTTNREVVTTISPNFGGSSTSRPGPSFVELNKFDLASVGLGMMAFLLIVILVGVVLMSIYRRHTRLRRQKEEVMDSKKSEMPVRTLAFAVNRHEKPAVQTKHSSNTSTSTASSTLSSYLTTV